MLEWVRFILCAVCTLSGLFVLISGIVGVFRFRYSLSRIHAGALFDTAGILLMLLGVMFALGFTVTTLKLALVIGFLWLTSPVASHLIGRLEVTIDDELDQHMTVQDPDMVQRQKEAR